MTLSIRGPAAVSLRPPAAGLAAQFAVLAVLAGSVGLGPAGWLAASAYAVTTWALLTRAVLRPAADRWGPADTVTLVRATLVGGVTALVADSLGGTGRTALIVALAAVALVGDAVDGQVARRTGTMSRLGARFDVEIDSALVLVLSVFVAASLGWWVVAIGAFRYAFVAAAAALPWLRRDLPPRMSRKTVAATQGIVLVVAAAGILPAPLAAATVAASLGVLCWSFGRDIAWLWRVRREPATEAAATSGYAEPPASDEYAEPPDPAGGEPDPAAPPAWRRRARAIAGHAATVLAAVLVLGALISPNELNLLTAGAFVRIPVEALAAVGVVLLLRGRARAVAAILFGLALGVLALVKILDMAFYTVLARRFDPVLDFPLLGAAFGVLSESVGRAGAIAAAVGAIVAAAALLVALPLAALRLARLVARHQRPALGTAAVLAVVWVLCAALSVQVVPGVPVAAATSDRLLQVGTGWHDLDEFAEESAVDAYADTPGRELLTALAGKDVILAYVESYGRDTIEAAPFADHMAPVLAAADHRLAAAGYTSRSGFLTSPTAGGGSWLAHATVQSGLWISNQRRYRTLVDSDRLTLSGAFRRAGWRTLGVMPGLTREWPEGEFFGYDRIYAPPDLGYAGPPFTAGTMPDQFTVAAFHRAERADPDHRPLMVELPLVSSHAPFAPLPRLLAWDALGDGSVFGPLAEAADPPAVVWRDVDRARLEYARAVEYSLLTLISYVETYGGEDLVLVVLGDHQAAPLVIGNHRGRDVPISIVAADPAVLDRIGGWGWHSGLRPGPDAPVWRMDTFRDRFLAAFSPQADPRPPAGPPGG